MGEKNNGYKALKSRQGQGMGVTKVVQVRGRAVHHVAKKRWQQRRYYSRTCGHCMSTLDIILSGVESYWKF